MDNLWIESFRYNKWANLYLFDVCGKLTDEQLGLSAPGTYGTIASTFQHLVSAEQFYLSWLTGSVALIGESSDFPGIARLRELAAGSGDRLIEVASKIDPAEMTEDETENGRVKLPLGVVIIQALHHGNDHRTHVCTILGTNGIDCGEMDVWAYANAIGAVVPIPAIS